VIAFLASDDARWITGDTIRVDGGSKLWSRSAGCAAPAMKYRLYAAADVVRYYNTSVYEFDFVNEDNDRKRHLQPWARGAGGGEEPAHALDAKWRVERGRKSSRHGVQNRPPHRWTTRERSNIVKPQPPSPFCIAPMMEWTESGGGSMAWRCACAKSAHVRSLFLLIRSYPDLFPERDRMRRGCRPSHAAARRRHVFLECDRMRRGCRPFAAAAHGAPRSCRRHAFIDAR
jgi:hypothetical protein